MMFDFMLLRSFLLAGQTSCPAGNIGSCLTSIYTGWFAVAGIAALAVLAILAFIYAISQFVGRSDIRAWTRVKIYDTILSLFLIIVFGYALSIIYTLPVSNFSTWQIVPNECTNNVYDIYSLSTCDMNAFNNFTGRFDYQQYVLLLLMGTLQTEIYVTWPISGNAPSSLLATTGLGVQVSAELSLVPQSVTFKYLGTGVDVIYGFVLANDLQLIILSSSALLFAILMSLGLIARIFGVTRTFGGAMIAFAIGIGLLYPMLTIITYGFINVGIDNIYPSAATTSLLALTSTGTGSNPVVAVFKVLDGYLTGSFASILPLSLIVYFGLIWIGLTFIPLITLIIVDVFIIDFSQAIGERMDLLSMMIRVL
jgi:hypothetical protein